MICAGEWISFDNSKGMFEMRRIEYYEQITDLFEFKTVSDECGNEYVLFKQSNCDHISGIKDRTEFEACENHVHLMDNVKKDEFTRLIPVVKRLGEAVLQCLKSEYPQKQFMVFVSLHLNDSMIIRFHQKWENEKPYCNPEDYKSEKEKVFVFTA